ncbi:hypothetical protein C8Q79DRAFT_1000099 [Trametes meyenii]|nr:hypothetical protein C8Q79DRAFT_1000099 [Trametes meyenii]
MPSRREADSMASSTGTREVNSLLHTLRGEQFRHSQNLRRSKAHLAAAASNNSYNDPSLPFSDIYQYAHTRPRNTPNDGVNDRDRASPRPIIRDGRLEHDFPRGPVPGPRPPRSWRELFNSDAGKDPKPAAYDLSIDTSMTAFRGRALSLIFSHTPWSFGSSNVPVFESSTHADRDASASAVPPLTQICLAVMLAEFPDVAGFRDELLPVIPPSFRRDILRFTAVHDPLPNAKLYPLFEPEGHADGELIVVGPQATLQRDVISTYAPARSARQHSGNDDSEDRGEGPSTSASSSNGADEQAPEDLADKGSWEAETSSQELSPPLQTVVVLNAPVPTGTLFAFPLILTRLALIALPSQTLVHRLPRICPLLEVLDLSYNPWLNEPPGGKGAENSETIVQRIEWRKWARLRVLGLRGCDVPQDVAERVNRGRWEDVEIVMEEHRAFRTSMSDVMAMMKNLRLTG